MELISFEHTEKVKLISRPKLTLSIKGASYLNKKAVSLLDIKHGDCLRFFFTEDNKLFIANDELGAPITLNCGLYRFCEKKAVLRIFEMYGVKGTKAEFVTAGALEEIRGKEGEIKKILLVIPKPFNII